MLLVKTTTIELLLCKKIYLIYFMDQQEEDEDYLSTSSVATLFSCIFTTSTHFNSIGANTTLCVELAQAAVRLIGWKDSAEEASVLELRNFLCSLCSFRSLQKRIQVFALSSIIAFIYDFLRAVCFPSGANHTVIREQLMFCYCSCLTAASFYSVTRCGFELCPGCTKRCSKKSQLY